MNITTIKQWSLWIVVLVMAGALETKAAMRPLETLEAFAAWQHIALSGVCAILAFALAAVASAMAADIRPEVRSRAWVARVVSIACLVVPICYLGTALLAENEAIRWAAYEGSAMMAADIATIADTMADTYVREAARARLAPPVIQLDITYGEFWIAAFFHLIVMGAASIRISAPATSTEIKHWLAVDRAQRGQATKERNRREREKQKRREAKEETRKHRPPWFGGVINGDKKST